MQDEAFIQWCRDELAYARDAIPRYESGQIKIGTQQPGQPMVDMRDDQIAHLRRTVENMERILTAYGRDHA